MENQCLDNANNQEREFWEKILSKYEKRNAMLKQHELILRQQFQAHSKQSSSISHSHSDLSGDSSYFSCPFNVQEMDTSSVNKGASECACDRISDDLCSQFNKQNKRNSVNDVQDDSCYCSNDATIESSIFSIGTFDLEYMKKLKRLTENEKRLKYQIQELENKEQEFMQKFENKNQFLSSIEGNYCNVKQGEPNDDRQSRSTNNQSRELENAKSILMECMKKINVPIPEDEEESTTTLSEDKQEGYVVEINNLKAQLLSTFTNIKTIDNVNCELRKELSTLKSKCNELQKDLIDQKINEAHTFSKLNKALQGEQEEGPCRKRKKRPKAPKKVPSEDNLDSLARKISKTLLDINNSGSCSVPLDLIEAAKEIKALADLVGKGGIPPPVCTCCKCGKRKPPEPAIGEVLEKLKEICQIEGRAAEAGEEYKAVCEAVSKGEEEAPVVVEEREESIPTICLELETEKAVREEEGEEGIEEAIEEVIEEEAVAESVSESICEPDICEAICEDAFATGSVEIEVELEGLVPEAAVEVVEGIELVSEATEEPTTETEEPVTEIEELPQEVPVIPQIPEAIEEIKAPEAEVYKVPEQEPSEELEDFIAICKEVEEEDICGEDEAAEKEDEKGICEEAGEEGELGEGAGEEGEGGEEDEGAEEAEEAEGAEEAEEEAAEAVDEESSVCETSESSAEEEEEEGEVCAVGEICEEEEEEEEGDICAVGEICEEEEEEGGDICEVGEICEEEEEGEVCAEGEICEEEAEEEEEGEVCAEGEICEEEEEEEEEGEICAEGEICEEEEEGEVEAEEVVEEEGVEEAAPPEEEAVPEIVEEKPESEPEDFVECKEEPEEHVVKHPEDCTCVDCLCASIVEQAKKVCEPPPVCEEKPPPPEPKPVPQIVCPEVPKVEPPPPPKPVKECTCDKKAVCTCGMREKKPKKEKKKKPKKEKKKKKPLVCPPPCEISPQTIQVNVHLEPSSESSSSEPSSSEEEEEEQEEEESVTCVCNKPREECTCCKRPKKKPKKVKKKKPKKEKKPRDLVCEVICPGYTPPEPPPPIEESSSSVSSSSSTTSISSSSEEPPREPCECLKQTEEEDEELNVTTAVTGAGTLEVTTEGPEGVIQTAMDYTESGNIEVTTEITDYPPCPVEEVCAEEEPPCPVKEKCIAAIRESEMYADVPETPKVSYPCLQPDDVTKDVTDALNKANRDLMDALNKANKSVTDAMEKANRDVESALDTLLKTSIESRSLASSSKSISTEEQKLDKLSEEDVLIEQSIKEEAGLEHEEEEEAEKEEVFEEAQEGEEVGEVEEGEVEAAEEEAEAAGEEEAEAAGEEEAEAAGEEAEAAGEEEEVEKEEEEAEEEGGELEAAGADEGGEGEESSVCKSSESTVEESDECKSTEEEEPVTERQKGCTCDPSCTCPVCTDLKTAMESIQEETQEVVEHPPDCTCIDCLFAEGQPGCKEAGQPCPAGCTCIKCLSAPEAAKTEVQEEQVQDQTEAQQAHPPDCTCVDCLLARGVISEEPKPEDDFDECLDVIGEAGDAAEETADKGKETASEEEALADMGEGGDICGIEEAGLEETDVPTTSAVAPPSVAAPVSVTTAPISVTEAHPPDCQCPDCLTKREAQQAKQPCAHRPDCECLECVCDTRKAECDTTRTHSWDCECFECICAGMCKTCFQAQPCDIEEVTNVADEVDEIKDLLSRIKSACQQAAIQMIMRARYTTDVLLRRRTANVENTLTSLQMALSCLQKKCKNKTYLLEYLEEELEEKEGDTIATNLIQRAVNGEEVDVRKVDFTGMDITGSIATSIEDSVSKKTSKYQRKVSKKDEIIKQPLEVMEVRRISPDSLLVKWTESPSEEARGYEIHVNGVVKSRVYSPFRTSAILHQLQLTDDVELSVYAVGNNGCLEPPAKALFQVTKL